MTARGGAAPPALPPWTTIRTAGAPGCIRLDGWGAAPFLFGTVDPAPTVIELPYLRTQSPPQIGATWILDIFAPENAPVFVAASLAPGSGAPTPYGPLGIDLVTAASLAVVSAPQSHDPVASVQWPIPNAPSLVGLAVWVQALAVPAALPARLTNTLAVVVQ